MLPVQCQLVVLQTNKLLQVKVKIYFKQSPFMSKLGLYCHENCHATGPTCGLEIKQLSASCFILVNIEVTFCFFFIDSNTAEVSKPGM